VPPIDIVRQAALFGARNRDGWKPMTSPKIVRYSLFEAVPPVGGGI
jgi:hypothetical protein